MIGATEETSAEIQKVPVRVPPHFYIFFNHDLQSYFIMEIPQRIAGEKAYDRFHKAQ